MSLEVDVAELLSLCTIPRVGSQRIRNLISRFHTPENICRASVRQLVEVEGIDQLLALKIKQGGNSAFVRAQLRKAHECGAKILTYWDQDYPQLLKQSGDPPLFLYTRGPIENLNAVCIAIVGTRAPSTYGKLMADRFARALATENIVVVSGLARGVDTIAHRAALQAGGKTVAVLGSGVDQIYPEENTRLAEDIAAHGVILSEFFMGAKPDAPHFPRRNRIISGLSKGTVVIEAGKKSGALITADFALEQNRDVFALPGNINNPNSFGCNYLIQQGAKLVTSVDDIMDEVGHSSTPKSTVPPPNLSSTEAKVYNMLSHEPKHIDAIALNCQLPVSKTLGILLTLELKNIVQQLSGKNFIRSL